MVHSAIHGLGHQWITYRVNIPIMQTFLKLKSNIQIVYTFVGTHEVVLLFSPHTPLHRITYWRFGSLYPRKLTNTSSFIAGKDILTAVLVRLHGWSALGLLKSCQLIKVMVQTLEPFPPLPWFCTCQQISSRHVCVCYQ